MRKTFTTTMLVLTLCLMQSVQLFAAESPFNTTTVENGTFAQGTIWYTLQIGNNGYVLHNNGSASYIALDDVISDATDDAQLWAFSGDNTNGYRLYNKETGANKVLAAPTTMQGQTGANSYPILVDANSVPAGYTDTWLFTASTDLGQGDTYYYMYEKDYPSNKVNNRDNKLAFWNSGADAGSTLNIRIAQAEYKVTTGTGEWTASNAAGTWAAGWKSTEAPHAILSETQGRNNIAGYDENGNLQLFTCLDNAVVDGKHIATYSISAESEDYMIASYRFNFTSSGASDVTVTPEGDSAVTAGSASQATVEATNSDEATALTFTVTSSSNMFANTKDFYITIVRKAPYIEPSTEIFVTNKGGIPYRIPAIAMAKNGDLIAVADYRHSGADIGVENNGRIDLHARISKDNGESWGDKFAIVEGQGANSPDFMHVGFGDPCIVADRESNRVLVLSCAGNVSFQNGTRNNHQNIARFYSEDNGATWSTPVDIAPEIYEMWDNSNHGPVMAMFVGSGKIHQSRYVKVNDYYRLYCAVLLKNKEATYTNFVLYSDDFGGSWSVLGGVNNAPIPSGGDEPKVEEFPNGNVVISSRINGGRDFNIFTFTNAERAEGSWGTRATSNANVNGVVAQGNSTNGEILIIPVVRNEDNKEMWMALQSVPFGSDRNNVGIYYKELETEADFNTPANFAKNWDGRHQASYMGSAYSTMCLQKDSTIAFLYEESTYGANYTIVYKNYSLEYITDSAYSVAKGKEPEIEPAEPIEPGAPVLPEDTKLYRIKSVSKNKYLNIESYNANNASGPKGSVGIADYTESNDQIFALEDAGNGKYYIVSADGYYIVCRQWNIDASNTGEKSQLGMEYANDTEFYITNGSQYFKVGEADGMWGTYYPYCDAPANMAEKWILEEVEKETAIKGVEIENGNNSIYDLTGRRIEKIARAGIYIINGKKVLVK